MKQPPKEVSHTFCPECGTLDVDVLWHSRGQVAITHGGDICPGTAVIVIYQFTGKSHEQPEE